MGCDADTSEAIKNFVQEFCSGGGKGKGKGKGKGEGKGEGKGSDGPPPCIAKEYESRLKEPLRAPQLKDCNTTVLGTPFNLTACDADTSEAIKNFVQEFCSGGGKGKGKGKEGQPEGKGKGKGSDGPPPCIAKEYESR